MEKIINNHNGIEYTHFRGTNGYGVMCIGESRFKIIGVPKFAICKGQKKFGDEMEVSVITDKSNGFTQEKRNNSKWNVVEIYFSLEEGKKIVKALYEELFGEKQRTL